MTLLISSVGAAVPAAGQSGQVASGRYQIGQWQFIPVADQQSESVVAFFAYYVGAQHTGDNFQAVIFERDEVGSWWGAVWPDTDLGLSAAYTIGRYGDGARSLLFDSVIETAIVEGGYDPDGEAPEPDGLGLGLSRDDPWYTVAAAMPEPGSLLELLRQSGHAITPELPAITARAAALESGDAEAIENVSLLAIGAISAPTPACDAAVTVSLAPATSAADVAGTNALLAQLAARAETALFDSTGYVTRGWFCGCGETCTACSGTGGAWTNDGSIGGPLERHCSYVRNGTKSCTSPGPGGLTFWCCNTCATSTYTRSCVEVCGTTVPNGAPCPPGGTVCPP